MLCTAALAAYGGAVAAVAGSDPSVSGAAAAGGRVGAAGGAAASSGGLGDLARVRVLGGSGEGEEGSEEGRCVYVGFF